jgi:branched-chain amino acid transport system substrate-binding protein
MKAAKASNPDAFVAWSYPPDTFGLAELAKIEGLDVKAYYSAVAVAFPAFKAKFGGSIEGILGAGGIQDSPEIRDFYKRHKEVSGVDADYWASPIYYSLLQMLTQAFESVGSMDRDAITEHLKNNTYKTIIGEMDVRKQKLTRYWTVGQWQEGTFHAVAGVGFSEYKPVKLKTGWA